MLHLVVWFAGVCSLVALNGCGSEANPSSGGEVSDLGEVAIDPNPGGDVGEDVDGPLAGADDSKVVNDIPSIAAKAAELAATTNVNLRSGPATTFAILAVIPAGAIVTVLDPTPKNGFLNVKFNGTAGWSNAGLFALPPGGGGTTGGSVDVNGAPSPDNAIARAKAAVGFSYYWGGGAWLEAGVTKETAGSCSGNCPSCTHSGTYGADCSGLVAKAWQFGPKALEVNSHPYSTANFVNALAGKWSIIARETVRKGDSLVYNTNGAGHMVIVEKGDAWGALTVYECRGCSYGCTYGTRSFASTYKTIRRVGF